MNIQSLLTNAKTFLEKYKWILIFVTPLLLLVLILSFTMNENATPQTPVAITPTESLVIPSETEEVIEEGNINVYENNELLQKKEKVVEDITKYTLTSPVASRPDIAIVDDTDLSLIYKRSVSDPSQPVILSEYLDTFGQAERIVTGSQFYGSTIQTHIYEDAGLALVVDPQTDLVLELHSFPSMTSEHYKEKYGEDLDGSDWPGINPRANY